ncbi:unnamed protein product [Arctia plantaginis]|uniref:procollagen-proline 4-dioxygenase n=1 Tax=Arctia plantaginis TaxID=874455 RepID=A0A8S1ASG0_ARCPL|nr:unnamed protein product [Arctia plantaginis]CAB3247912.1 unnamed protein product [Arctia plantaginis]
MENLLIPQNTTINDLESYIGMQQKKLSVLKRYLKLYIRENEKIKEDVISYLDNPLKVFILKKRLISDLDNLPEIIKIGSASIPYFFLKHVDHMYPEKEDLTDAALAVARLANIYNLDVNDLANGNLNNIAYTSPMTASDCYELSLALLSKNKYFEAGRAWMVAAHRKYNEENVAYPFTEDEIVKYLNEAYSVSKYMKSAPPSTQHMFNIYDEESKKSITEDDSNRELLVNPPGVPEEIRKLSGVVQDLQQFQTYLKSIWNQLHQQRELETTSVKDEKELENYEALCRGDLVVPAKISNRLTCRYLTENNPFLRIAPFKVETMYLNPDLILFYDVLSDIEIETIKQNAKPLLSRAQINHPETGYLVNASYRISKVAWLSDQDSEIIAQITRRVAQMTGLNMELSKEFQVVNYGIGGHYEPHFDFTKMSDVTQGGATVFPELGVRLLPVKGTAAFWFNLHPSLEGDYAMRHAACPVLQGDKWVVSKFVHRVPQIFIRPCELEYQKEGFVKKILAPTPKTLL